jgi:hypothetical protein
MLNDFLLRRYLRLRAFMWRRFWASPDGSLREYLWDSLLQRFG